MSSRVTIYRPQVQRITVATRGPQGPGSATPTAHASSHGAAGADPISLALSQISDATANGRSLISAADYAAMRMLLGLVIGNDIQAFAANLSAIAGLVSAADKLGYFTGSGTAALADLTAAGRALLDDADAAAQRTTLGLGSAALSAADAFQSALAFTLSGTATRTYTFPSTDATLARTDSAQTFSGNQTFSGRLIVSVNGALSAPGTHFNGTWISGGTGTTTKPHLLIEPAGATSAVWTTGGTGLGVNSASGFTGRLLELMTNGSSRFIVTQTGLMICNGAAQITGGQLTIGLDAILYRNAAANIQQGGADAAAPVAQTFSAQSAAGGTSNTPGAARNFWDSIGTGNQNSGGYWFYVHPAGSSGTTQNTATRTLGFSISGSGAVTLYGNFAVPKTVTTPGTTGNVTINKISGRVNFAAAATTLRVSNSLVDANSIIMATIATNDATATGLRVVAAAGYFDLIFLTATTTETAVNFFLTN